MVKVIHSIHFPVSARSFVEPIVEHLNQANIATELWLEHHAKHSSVIEQIKVPKRFVESDLTFNPFKFWTRLQRYRQALRIAQPSILHAHQTRAALIPLLAAVLEQVPVRIYHNHGLPYLGYQSLLRWTLQCLEQINLTLATHTLLVSHSNQEAAEFDRLLPDSSKVIGYGSAVGLDLNQFREQDFNAEAKQRARTKLRLPENAFVLGFVGRPVKRKGFHLLLEAWQRSRLGEQGYCLILAGCTQADCKAAIAGKLIGVKAFGYLTDLREFYAACDAIVLPSYHEGFPYCLLEGAAAGKPLIGTDIPGIRCAIADHHTGLLVPVNNVKALADAIARLASEPELRRSLGQNARKRVEQQFERSFVLSKLLEFYEAELLPNLENARLGCVLKATHSVATSPRIPFRGGSERSDEF